MKTTSSVDRAWSSTVSLVIAVSFLVVGILAVRPVVDDHRHAERLDLGQVTRADLTVNEGLLVQLSDNHRARPSNASASAMSSDSPCRSSLVSPIPSICESADSVSGFRNATARNVES